MSTGAASRYTPGRVVRALRRRAADASREIVWRLRMAPAWCRYRFRREPRPEIQLAVCAIFRDEASYLAEWVAFHSLVGVERFYLYNNSSTDDWRAALQPELEAGIVTVTDWQREASVSTQTSAYEDCLRRHRADMRWIAFIDVDEFLFSPTGDALPAVLPRFASWPGVLAGWRLYGTGGWRTRPEGLVTESYLQRAPDDLPSAWATKPIVNPYRTVPWVRSPHLMQHWKPGNPFSYTITRWEDGTVGSDRVPTPIRPIPTDWLRINHYRSKSLEEAQVKVGKGRLTDQCNSRQSQREHESWLVLEEHNQIRDEAILPYVPELKTVIAQRETCSFRG